MTFPRCTYQYVPSPPQPRRAQPGSDNSPSWDANPADKRPGVEDWRYASRLKDARRDISPPRNAPPPSDTHVDSASRSVEVGHRARERNQAGVAFSSKEVRRAAGRGWVGGWGAEGGAEEGAVGLSRPQPGTAVVGLDWTWEGHGGICGQPPAPDPPPSSSFPCTVVVART